MIVYALFPQGQGGSITLYDTTFFPALKNVSEHFGYTYIPCRADKTHMELVESVPKTQERVFFVTNFTLDWKREHYDALKKRIPNSEICWFGSDTHYHGLDAAASEMRSVIDLPLKRHVDAPIFKGLSLMEWPIDLYLDPIKAVAKDANLVCDSYHFYWTISEDTIKKIESKPLKQKKIYDGICLCSTDNRSYHRKEMFDRTDKDGLTVLRNLNEHDLDKIFNLYSQSWATIGTTTACMASEIRSMKGFRDWLAPFCNSVLIYDDFVDIVDIGDFIPLYNYGEWGQIKELIDKLKSDSVTYNKLIEAQKKWTIQNTLERQFIRIFKAFLNG